MLQGFEANTKSDLKNCGKGGVSCQTQHLQQHQVQQRKVRVRVKGVGKYMSRICQVYCKMIVILDDLESIEDIDYLSTHF